MIRDTKSGNQLLRSLPLVRAFNLYFRKLSYFCNLYTYLQEEKEKKNTSAIAKSDLITQIKKILVAFLIYLPQQLRQKNKNTKKNWKIRACKTTLRTSARHSRGEL
jgi:hypothetical protein